MVSIILPAFNEESSIGKALDRLAEEFPGSEVLVMSESNDRTNEIVESAKPRGLDIILVKGSERSGKWESIRRGIIAAKGEYVAFMDVDMSVPATEASRLLGILQENGLDIVISSRYVGGSLVAQRQPLARIVFSRVFNRWVRLVFGMPYKDTQCGFKAFRAGIARRVASSMRCRGFEGDVEFLWLARKLGASVREEPVLWRDSETSSFRLRKGFGILFNLLKVRFWWHRGQETL